VIALGEESKPQHIDGKARIGVGLVAVGERSSKILDGCRERLSSFFAASLPDFHWVLDKEAWEGEWLASLRILDRAQARMEEAQWQFCFIILDREPDVPTFPSPGSISFSHSAATIFLPRLIPYTKADDIEAMTAGCCNLVLSYFARLNGLPRTEEAGTTSADLEGGSLFNQVELGELNSSLHSMTDGLLKKGVKEVRGLALYMRVILSHPMRVIRTVLSHHPLRMVFSLGKLVFAAMAALVLSLLSTELWQLGIGINTWRLILIAVAVLLAATIYVVFQQRLFVRRVSMSLSEQAAFFNLTSFLTVFSVFLVLFLVIFAVTILVTLGIYPRYIVKGWLLKNELGFGDYVRVSLLISSLALIVGALGAGLEENQHFRQVMYTEKNR
jgi:membrane protease YdiL (CAAX protease family)